MHRNSRGQPFLGGSLQRERSGGMMKMKAEGLRVAGHHVGTDPAPDEPSARPVAIYAGTTVRCHESGKFPADLLPEMGTGRRDLVEVESASVVILMQACGDIKTATLDHVNWEVIRGNFREL